MDIESRLELVKEAPTEEIVTENEMRSLLETKAHPVHYIGFEISGMPHIGHILVAGKKINDFDKAGIKTQVWLAEPNRRPSVRFWNPMPTAASTEVLFGFSSGSLLLFGVTKKRNASAKPPMNMRSSGFVILLLPKTLATSP